MRYPKTAAMLAALSLLLLSACAGDDKVAVDLPAELAGTSWQLLEIQSMDDAVGTIAPDDPAKYTLSLGSTGELSMRLDCNRGAGTWMATAATAESGSIEFSPLAVTKAYCPQPSLDQKVAQDMAYVRSYLIQDGLLALSLFADGGIYLWGPLQ